MLAFIQPLPRDQYSRVCGPLIYTSNARPDIHRANLKNWSGDMTTILMQKDFQQQA